MNGNVIRTVAGVAIVICAISVAAVASVQQRALPQADGFFINEDGNSIGVALGLYEAKPHKG